jgi:hypothetical protein
MPACDRFTGVLSLKENEAHRWSQLMNQFLAGKNLFLTGTTARDSFSTSWCLKINKRIKTLHQENPRNLPAYVSLLFLECWVVEAAGDPFLTLEI